MYNNKLAVALKSNGKVLREFGEEVYVPFGSEYSIFIKNLNSVRALVKVSVDGIDVGDGTRFVIDGDDTMDIERFIKNGNFNEGNRLKFIERTQNVEKHRGVGIEDGLVRIEFNFEKVIVHQYHSSGLIGQWINDNTHDGFGTSNARGLLKNATYTTSSVAGAVNYSADVKSVNLVQDVEQIINNVENDAGITVPGSVSDQQFQQANWFATENETHVIVLKILGETKNNVQVKRAVTVKAKSKCSSCGRTNKATAKFCTECGTSLQIV